MKPNSGLRIEGRIKQRKVKPKPEYRELVEALERQGKRNLLTSSMFYTTKESKDWDHNLITTTGLSRIKDSFNGGIGALASTFAYGVGSGVPALSDTTLFSYAGYAGTRQAIPSEYKANDYDYTNGRVTYTFSWLSSLFTETKTLTEGGFGSTTILSHFMFDEPFTVEAGEYYNPIYQLIITLSPTITPETYDAPFITGADGISASGRYETLFCAFPPARATSEPFYKDTSSGQVTSSLSALAQLCEDEGLISSGDTIELLSTQTPSSSYYSFAFRSWPNVNSTGPSSMAWPKLEYSTNNYSYFPRLYLVLATDATPLVFSQTGHIVTGVLEAFDIFSSDSGAGYGISDPDTSDYSTILQKTLHSAYGNYSGIRSIAWCIKESPVGSTDWQYRSLYRILLDSSFEKAADKILTLNFKRSWA